MTVFERIQELCDRDGIAITALETKLGFAHSSLSNLEKTNIRSDRLLVLSKYFDVSTDWLLTGEEHEQNTYSLTDREWGLIEMYRNLIPMAQDLVFSQFKVYRDAGFMKKSDDTSKVKAV